MITCLNTCSADLELRASLASKRFSVRSSSRCIRFEGLPWESALGVELPVGIRFSKINRNAGCCAVGVFKLSSNKEKIPELLYPSIFGGPHIAATHTHPTQPQASKPRSSDSTGSEGVWNNVFCKALVRLELCDEQENHSRKAGVGLWPDPMILVWVGQNPTPTPMTYW